MTSNDTVDNSTQATKSDAIKTLWLNPRRKWFWAIVAVLLYTLLGFFAVPAIVKNSLINLVEEDFGRTAHIEKVEFNPFVLSLRVQQFEMNDTDTVKVAAFDEFFVNFQLSSLFRWAWTFREIRLVNSYFYFERFAVEDSRVSRLLADIAKNQPSTTDDTTEEEQGKLPRLLVHHLKLIEGHAVTKDHVPASPVDMHIGPINVSIRKLNTLPDRYGKQTVSIALPNDASLQWEGNLSLTPLDSMGEVVLTNADLSPASAYLRAMLPLESLNASLSSRFQYHIQIDSNGELNIDLDQLALELDGITVTGLSPTTEFLSIPQLSLHGGTLRYPEQSLLFSNLRFDTPQLTIWRNGDGRLSLSDLTPAAEKNNSPEATPDKKATPWQLGINELILENGSLNFSDQSIKPPAAVGIIDLLIKMSDITNQDGATIPLNVSAKLSEGGDFGLDASMEILPEFTFSGKSQTRGIPLSVAQPYVQQFSRILIDSGKLDSDIEISMPAGQGIKANGAIQIPDLEIKDAIENKRLLGWNNLDIDRLELDLGAGNLNISRLNFDQPFGRIVVFKDQSTNLSDLVVERKSTTQAKAESPAKTEKTNFDVIIGGIGVDEGSMDFSDLSLPLPFATRIKSLNGTISTIATNSSEPANIKLEGQVKEYGLSRIHGAINLLAPLQYTDITLEFRNLLMSDLSPYTIQFAGREINEGRLNLDLQYAIERSHLQARNNIVISDLQLGKKVEHPDAADLPLGLAVALLKDSNGVIDLSLPIEGNIDDPEFEIGGIIWQAFSGLIIKAVTAPFQLLANLIGVESDDFGQLQFLAGRFDLTPPELEKIAKLKEALLKRPQLTIKISGGTDAATDTPALKDIHLRNIIIERLGKDAVAEGDNIIMLDDDLRPLLEKLFTERFPDIPLKTLKKQNTAPPADDPEGKPVRDNLAYSASLRDHLLDSVAISEVDLATLAQARAESIKAAFLTGEFDNSRVVIVEPEDVKSKDGQWVTLELNVASE